jgi:hypothetical protein
MAASAGAAGVVAGVLGADVAVVPAIEIAAAGVGGDVVVVFAAAAAGGDVVVVMAAAGGGDVVVVVAGVGGGYVVVVVVAGGGGGFVVVVVVVAVAVVAAAAAAAAAGAVSMPTLHSGFHRTRCQSGEDIYCTQGTGETHDTVQRHWVNPMGYVLSTWKTTRK